MFNLFKLWTWPPSSLHNCQTSWKNSLLISLFSQMTYCLVCWNCSNSKSSMTLFLNLVFLSLNSVCPLCKIWPCGTYLPAQSSCLPGLPLAQFSSYLYLPYPSLVTIQVLVQCWCYLTCGLGPPLSSLNHLLVLKMPCRMKPSVLIS